MSYFKWISNVCEIRLEYVNTVNKTNDIETATPPNIQNIEINTLLNESIGIEPNHLELQGNQAIRTWHSM